MRKSKVGSKSLLGIDAIVNGEPYHFGYLQLEYPQKPNERPADLAPGMPGFYTISARAQAKAIHWMEQCFASGSITIEVARKPSVVISYSQPVDAVTEFPGASLRDRLTGRLSASFGFYQVIVIKKNSRPWPKLTLTA